MVVRFLPAMTTSRCARPVSPWSHHGLTMVSPWSHHGLTTTQVLLWKIMVSTCLTMSQPLFYTFSIMSQYVSICLNMSQYVSICLNMSQYVSICLNMSQYVSMCLNMSQYVPICPNMSQYVSICLNMSQYVSICLNMSQYVSICLNESKKSQWWDSWHVGTFNTNGVTSASQEAIEASNKEGPFQYRQQAPIFTVTIESGCVWMCCSLRSRTAVKRDRHPIPTKNRPERRDRTTSDKGINSLSVFHRFSKK